MFAGEGGEGGADSAAGRGAKRDGNEARATPGAEG